MGPTQQLLALFEMCSIDCHQFSLFVWNNAHSWPDLLISTRSELKITSPVSSFSGDAVFLCCWLSHCLEWCIQQIQCNTPNKLAGLQYCIPESVSHKNAAHFTAVEQPWVYLDSTATSNALVCLNLPLHGRRSCLTVKSVHHVPCRLRLWRHFFFDRTSRYIDQDTRL
jgi:hypothetical protein